MPGIDIANISSDGTNVDYLLKMYLHVKNNALMFRKAPSPSNSFTVNTQLSGRQGLKCW
jgi:hypothetical protein